MARRKLLHQEKKKPCTYSVEKSIYDDFQNVCANQGTNMSRELRKFMIKYIEENKLETK